MFATILLTLAAVPVPQFFDPLNVPSPKFAAALTDNCGQYTCPANGGKGGCKCDVCRCVVSRPASRPLTVYLFTAKTCVPCKQFLPTFLGWRRPGVNLVIADIDDAATLRSHYGVVVVPAVVVTNGTRYKDFPQASGYLGVPSEAEFEKAVKVLQEGK